MTALDQIKDPIFHLAMLEEVGTIWSPLIVVSIVVIWLRFGAQLRRMALELVYSLTGEILAAHGTKTLFNGQSATPPRVAINNRRARRAERPKRKEGPRSPPERNYEGQVGGSQGKSPRQEGET